MSKLVSFEEAFAKQAAGTAEIDWSTHIADNPECFVTGRPFSEDDVLRAFFVARSWSSGGVNFTEYTVKLSTEAALCSVGWHWLSRDYGVPAAVRSDEEARAAGVVVSKPSRAREDSGGAE